MRVLHTVSIAASLLFLWGCQGTENPDAPAPVIAGDPVVVYAAYEDLDYLPVLFEDFTRVTGLPVIVRNGASAQIVDDVIQNRISPPADLLWVASIADAWRAAEKGALRPAPLATIAAEVLPTFRDPDGYWSAVSYGTAVVAYNPQFRVPASIEVFADLAKPDFSGRLCLSSSANSINQAVIAMLINTQQVRSAEIAVRGWVANLAKPPVANDAALIAELETGGDCDVGIVSGTAAFRAKQSGSALEVVVPKTTAVEAEAIGVTRHARNPEGAESLLAWLMAAATQERHAASMQVLPANTTVAPGKDLEALMTRAGGVRIVIADRYEAKRLAERARYR